MNKNILFSLAMLISSIAHSQSGGRQIQMADFMRSNGMIWVVVAVLLCIFSGLLIYLFRIDRKLRKVEKGAI